MRKNTFTSVIVLLTALWATSAFAQNTVPFFKNPPANVLNWQVGSHSTLPEFVQFDSQSNLPVEAVSKWLRHHFGLSADFDLQLKQRQTDQLGIEHLRYQQTYNNVPIEGAMYLVHAQNQKVTAMNGVLAPQITAPTTPQIAESVALNNALQHIGAQHYRWQSPQQEAALQREQKNPNATYYPKGQLVYSQKQGSENGIYYLCYKFDVYADAPLQRNYLFIDAQTGSLINQENRLCHTDAAGTAVTKYSGTRSITTDYTGSTYRLREGARGNGIETYNCQQQTDFIDTDFTDANNNWNNVNANHDEVATDAHWGAEVTYDYYNNVHNRHSIDDNDMTIRSYVHYGSSYFNAFWDGDRMAYGDGSGSATALTALDIAGHEMTHGVTQFSAGLNYINESGALNEGFSDIFGTIIEFYAKPNSANWLLGSEIGSTFRSISNPNAYQQPDTYLGTNWYTGSGDNGGVHTNSGVVNYWFYLLTMGGNGTNDLGNSFTVTGLGMEKTRQIAYRTLTNYLFPTSNYADTRFYSILATIDLYGACSPELTAVTNAWYAVGVGGAYDGIITANFTADVVAGCAAPLSVTFNNSSINAGSFVWDFGDGTTSTEVSPTHTYTTLGNFSVQLIANAGSCGNNTFTRNNYISINPANPCIYSMPASGNAATISPCSGILYDAGGVGGNYLDNTTSTITIAPTGAGAVSVSFSSFDLEENYDYLYVYDGTSDEAPNIGLYTSNTLPNSGNPIVAYSGAMTLKLVSDPFVAGTGFALSWNCSSITAAPTTNFSANVQTTCSGNVHFTDLSTNVPTAWLWNFGDGTNSTEENPNHSYSTSGTYTVSLQATNSFGNNTNTKNNYISVSKPAAPSIASQTVCNGESATFTASGSDTYTWYDAANNGNTLYEGNVFQTPALTNNTNYYVTKASTSPIQNVGPTSNGIGTESSFGLSNRWLVFDVLQPARLVSVKVYANGGLNRTIQLRNAQGAVLQDTSLYVNDGESRITLNFDLPVGTNLQLATAATSEMSRNSNGAVFPYTLPGVLSITGTNAPAGYYYFFYDWEVQLPTCVSQTATITATVKQQPTPVVVGDNVSCQTNKSYTVQNPNVAHNYTWAVTGGTIVSGQGTPTVIVNWTDSQVGLVEVAETAP